MQTANILLALGGDAGNTVPKRGVTAAEIAVLLAIHGNESVTEIEPVGTVARASREERHRLMLTYPARDHDDKSIVEGLFPGVAARVFDTIDELGIDESFFKATGRVTADPLDHDGDGKKGGVKGRKPKAKKADETAAEQDEVEAAEGIAPGDDEEADAASDGVGDMPEGEDLFK